MADTPQLPSMRLMNVIIVWDVYAVAQAEGPAIEAVIELIKSGEISASQFKALELRASPVRPAWRDERPIVAADISDEDFEKLKGKTTQEVYDLLKKKHGGGAKDVPR